MLTADVNLSISDTPPSQHLTIPESDAPQDEVLVLDRLFSIYPETSSTLGAYAYA